MEVGGGDTDPKEFGFQDGEAPSPNHEGGLTTGLSRILEVDVVMEELLWNLTVEEMKLLSSVSKDALFAVRKSKSFSDRVQFRICKDLICSRVLENCLNSWKSVRFCFYVDIDDDDDRLEDYIPTSSTILQSLHSVQSLLVEVHYQNLIEESLRFKISTFALKIIESSKETLEDLTLYLLRGDLDGIESIQCPNLKRLKLSRHREMRDEVVEKLLRNLPPLEKLTVGVCHPSKLFGGLQGRMSKLRELDIKIIGDSREDSTLPRARAFDWNVVADMTRLEDISITMYHGCRGADVQDVEDFLVNIPANKVKKVFIAEFSGREFCFSQKLGEHIISRFDNLTELSLCNLKRFGDDSLQSVIKGCQKLKTLYLDNLRELTDFGFSGVKIIPAGGGFLLGLEEPGVSLANLRDLVRLTIRDCDLVSIATLLGVIRFEFLTFFELRVFAPDFKTHTSRNVLLQILQQNPNLTEVEIGINRGGRSRSYYPLRDVALEDEAKALYSRIQRIEFAFSAVNILNHLGISDDDSSDWSDDLFSDSD